MTVRLVLPLAAVVVAAVALALPPRAVELGNGGAIAEPVRGVLHVHTRRSDGSGTVEEVAAAAARAGLKFVIFSDHGDATRQPDPPGYVDGVLCIDAVEVTTFGGHVLALGLPGKAPYRLGGEARDVIEDVQRLGGMALAAHPQSARDALRWDDWGLNFDGIEWLNADSEWRDEPVSSLAFALLTYPWRRPETLGRLLDRPGDVLTRWDQRLRTRRSVAVAAADAHASIGFGRPGNPFYDGRLLALPGYEQLFRAFSVALPAVRLENDAVRDSASILDEIRRGRVYSSVDARARPGRLDFTAQSGAVRALGGDVITPGAESVTFTVRTNGPSDARIDLLRDGSVAASSRGQHLQHVAPPGAGVYRVEVFLDGGRASAAPWLLSNPIHVGRPAAPASAVFVPKKEAVLYAQGAEPSGTRIETNAKSLATFDVMRVANDTRLRLRYGLGGTADDSPYAALIVPAGPQIAEYQRVVFQARADRPMRLWVYLWAHGPNGGRHWRRSVYIDDVERTVVVAFDDVQAVSASEVRRPPLDVIDSLRFVVDQIHTPLGAKGYFWIDDVKYQR